MKYEFPFITCLLLAASHHFVSRMNDVSAEWKLKFHKLFWNAKTICCLVESQAYGSALETRDFLLQLYAELSCEVEPKVSCKHCMATQLQKYSCSRGVNKRGKIFAHDWALRRVFKVMHELVSYVYL